MLAEALAADLNPRELERLIRGHASKEQIADAFGLSVAVVESMMTRWGLSHLSGRAHPYWRARYGLRAEDFPHSQRAYERTFSLPLYSRMTEADAERVAGVLRGVLTR